MGKIKQQYDLLQDPVRKLFLRYLVPSVSGTLVTAIYILVDTIIVGKGIGSDAVAGLNIVLPLFSLFYGTGLLFGVGGAVHMSFSKGRKQEGRAQAYFTAALFCMVAASVVYMAVFQVFFQPVTRFLGASDATAAYVSGYGRTVVWGAPCFMFSAFLQAFVRNDGAPKLAMAGTIAGGVTNIMLDLLFVYVFDWGMFGAAFASVLGNGLGVIVLCTHFCSHKNTLKLNLKEVNWKTPLHVMKTGFSSFLIEMSAGIITFLFNIQLMHYIGVAGVTAYSILSNTAIMLVSMSNGVSQAAQPIIATNCGGGQMRRAAQVRRLGLLFVCGIGFVFSGTALLFPNLLVSIFIHPTPEVAHIALPAIRVYGVSFLLTAINLFISNYFQAVLKPGYAMTISLCRGLVLNLCFVFLLPLALGAEGIWLSVPLTELLTVGLACFLRRKEKQAQKGEAAFPGSLAE